MKLLVPSPRSVTRSLAPARAWAAVAGALFALLALLVGLSASAQARQAADTEPVPAIAAEDVAAWRAAVLPAADELAYAQVDWIPSFAAGIRRADEERRPLLFWAMNGHPLGCT